ncbi:MULTISPECIES: helix-turn-helix domain-containing protein [Mycolicibacterium]|uniref:helix-turn-helix domain-containing protein n=1 Tax=Mycolicibacterium TaxID=1866885 RepID=UPI0007EBCD84|nr:helix-turn-helix domain-containing protein [Mycolicibacterium fortuitum]OBG24105.1 hypothetical protein A5768_22305 [Mycolicibacterium fortuitum]
MTSRQPFQHAIQNSSIRRDITLAVHDGIPPDQLAEEFGISLSTVHRYAAEWDGADRKVRALNADQRQQIIDGCRRGARRRYEREYGARVVEQVMGEG